MLECWQLWVAAEQSVLSSIVTDASGKIITFVYRERSWLSRLARKCMAMPQESLTKAVAVSSNPTQAGILSGGSRKVWQQPDEGRGLLPPPRAIPAFLPSLYKKNKV